MDETRYVQGETIAINVADGGYDSVSVNIGGKASALTLTDGRWTANIATTALSGSLRYAILATTNGATKCIESGNIIVAVMRSPYRDVVDAINTAIQSVAVNGKYSVTVGEISLTDKTFDEMVKFAAYYKGLAEDAESGNSSTGRVGSILMEF